MDLLIDTHSLIWFFEGNMLLPEEVRKLITNRHNNCFVSIASIWEATIKLSIGKLNITIPPSNLRLHLENESIQVLPVSFEHLAILETLPFYHRDPFDRLIISQAITHNLTIISKDTNFSQYSCKIFW
jgi:PIN domain nuclease of toxin-antitoxin system